MKKLILSCAAIAGLTSALMAQSVDEGKKLLYYNKVQSARNVLQQEYNKNNKDPKAIYWLGQAMLDADDVAGAKKLYQDALTAGVNDPYLWVGMAHVNLLEGGAVADAKQKFEQAITATTETKGKNKGKENVDILLAIARANADGGSRVGDPVYGAEKARRAAELEPTNAEAPLLAGVNYLKMGGEKGGEAVVQFTEAANRNPNLAEAYYRIGRIYQSQDNKESMENYYSKAIEKDAAYAPTYYGYYQYYEERDVNAAKEFLDKYVRNSDQDCQTDYFQANYLFRAGRYQESLDKAKQMSAGNCANYPRVNVLYAYNYQRLGDSLQSKAALDKFFATETPARIQPDDYAFASSLYLKFPGEVDKAIGYIEQAITTDTVARKRIGYLNDAAAALGKAGQYRRQLEFLQRAVAAKGGTPSEADYYKLAKAASDGVTADASLYPLADSITSAYIAAYPDKPQGYTFRVLSAKRADTAGVNGYIVAPIEQQITYQSKDVEKNRAQIYVNYYNLLVYYNDKKKDKAKAIEMTDKMLELYPTPGTEENTFAANTKKALQGSPAPARKPAAGGSGKAAPATPKKK